MSNNTKKIDDLKKRLEGSLDKIITDSVSKSLGDKVVDIIKRRSRRGYGITDNEGSAAFEKLADSTVEQRKRYKRNLSSETRPSKSNITGTGQMLDSMRSNPQRGKIQVEIPKSKRRKELSGAQSTLTNAEVAGYVQQNGRKFFGLTKRERSDLVREVKQILLTGLKSLLNKK